MLHVGLSMLALAATALVASGCGGSSKSGTSATTAAASKPSTTTTTTTSAPTPTVPSTTVKLATGTPLTRATWIAKGDAICGHVNTEVAAISVRTTSEAGRLIPQIAVYYSTEAADLSKLVPPASMAADGTQIVNGIQLLSEYLSKSAQQFQANNDNEGSHLLRTALEIQKQPIAVAKRDGFKKCTDKD